MLTGIVQIHVHLTGIGVREFSPFEIDHHQTPQAAVKEKQIHAVPFITNAQTFLSAHKGEVATEFEKKMLKVQNQSLLEVAFGLFVFQAQELQNIGIFDLLFRGNGVLRFRLRAPCQHSGFVLRESGSFVELGLDLPVKLAHGPAAT